MTDWLTDQVNEFRLPKMTQSNFELTTQMLNHTPFFPQSFFHRNLFAFMPGNH